MKITILALISLAFATAPLARAQEETPAPEAAAPEKSESSSTDPSVSVTTEKSSSPAAEKNSSPAAQKSSSPAAAQSKAAPPPKASSTATKSPAAVMPTKKSTPETTLKDIEDKWEASFMSHDPSVAQAYVGNDYRGVSSKGKVMSKANLLAEMKKDTDTYTSAKNGNMDARVYGGHFAVVMGTSVETGKDKSGKAFKRSFRWTDSWVERDGKWQCVASQSMQLSK